MRCVRRAEWERIFGLRGSSGADAGVNLGAEYQYDLMGVNQNLFGTKWEIGAFAYVPERLVASPLEIAEVKVRLKK